jgi:hypothetical protein
MEAAHRPEDLQPSNLEASVAVMAVEMRYVRAGIEELKVGQQQNVGRREYEDFKGAVEKELNARRLPWPSVGAFIIAAAGLLLVVIDRVAN